MEGPALLFDRAALAELAEQLRGDYVAAEPFPHVILECLEADADLLMAFSRIEPVVTDDVSDDLDRYRHPRIGPGAASWTVHDGVATLRRLRVRRNLRRAPGVGRGLHLPRMRDWIDADVAWVFGMALLGRLRDVQEIAYLKRHLAASAHRTWRRRAADQLVLGWTLGCFAARYGRSPGVTLLALAAADYVADQLTRVPRRRCNQLLGRR